MSLITCRDLSFGYDGRITVDQLNFEVESGQYLCIVGENGAGKSTLIKGLLHLKKPAGGTLEYGDGLSRDEIGYLPQQTQVQKNFPASVSEVVLSGCLNRLGHRPFYRAAEKELAIQNMEELEILELKDRCYRELSGGQQQRVLLARALCATRKLVLLDEPVAGLDPLVTQNMYDIIYKINQKLGITVVMVSHDLEAALRYADTILQLGHKQLFFGSVEEYRRSPQYRFLKQTRQAHRVRLPEKEQ